MTKTEKEAAERLVKAIESLPDAKKEWVLGYAEGLISTTLGRFLIQTYRDSASFLRYVSLYDLWYREAGNIVLLLQHRCGIFNLASSFSEDVQ